MSKRLGNAAALTTVLATALLIATAGTAAAQVSTTRGFNAGFQLQGASLAVESGDRDTGGGAELRAGYGINRIVTLFVGVAGASVNALNASNVAGVWEMAHFDLGARFHLANALRSWVPYLEASATSRAVSVANAEVDGERQISDNVTFNGGAFTLGGGLAIYLSEQLAFDLGLKVTGGEFTNIKLGNVTIGGLEIDATSTRLGFGILWWKG